MANEAATATATANAKRIVIYESEGQRYFLRGTIWAYSRDRANVFASDLEARTALDRARKFMKPLVYKRAKVVDFDSVGDTP